jgi:hypothetical protein
VLREAVAAYRTLGREEKACEIEAAIAEIERGGA